MKIVALFLLGVLVFSCSSKEVSINDEPKLLQIKCTIWDDTLDTFNNTYTRYTYSKTHIVPFYFSNAEQKKIIMKINQINFFELPDSILPKRISLTEMLNGDTTGYYEFHNGEIQYCLIELEKQIKKIYYYELVPFLYTDNDNYMKLISLKNIITEIISEREEIKKLPRQLEL